MGIFFLFALTNSLKAQNLLNSLVRDFQFKMIKEGTYPRNNLSLSDIQGSPYLDKEFSPGKIYTNEGGVYENIPLRYNGYTDDLEFQKDKDSYSIDPKSIVKRAEFGGMIFCCLKYDDNGKSKDGFFEVLAKGKATLLVKYSIKFLEKEEVKGYSNPNPARFDEAQKEYYIAFDSTTAKLIINKKNLLELFGTQKTEMESYISKNKLSVKNDDALTKIVIHYNSL
jgi:hypothetical protein